LLQSRLAALTLATMKQINSALISVFYKDGLEPLVQYLHRQSVTIYTTGGTQTFIEQLGIPCVAVESLTSYPSILGGRVKTLHPAVFGGILGKRNDAQHVQEMKTHQIPEIDLVIVDLYPFEETVKNTNEETLIIEKIDIGGPSMIRAAAKNFNDLTVLASKEEYAVLLQMLQTQNGATSLEQRRGFAAKAFDVVKQYDTAIADYFNPPTRQVLRYGENPHQQAAFSGNLGDLFTQLHGKELSYNNLLDVDAAVQLIREMPEQTVFAIIKHNNVCGVALRPTVLAAWQAALQGDPESAFGGVLVCNNTIDLATAEAINEIFFEVLMAPAFAPEAMAVLQSKKNRILLQTKNSLAANTQFRSLLNGVLQQDADLGNFAEWKEAGGRESNAAEKTDLSFANIVCKHLKSNAIALVKNQQLIGKGCGQTSRVDALRQAIEKARQFNFDLQGASLASDAFFPFDDCVKMAHAAGVAAFIQPGGSIRDKDSIDYCQQNGLAMVLTATRHFKH
jgi:phosphoribosylaminoimidazolecarboxamide formyltransferase / IMP cyclohydrolase